MSTLPITTLTVTIDAPYAQVAQDLANPDTHTEWATEFFSGPATPAENGAVRVNVPAMGGDVLYRTEADVDRGILDFYFAQTTGASLGPPLPVRLLHNGDGVDVLWTLTRFPETPDDRWEAGIASMERELQNLKHRHEKRVI